MATIKRHASAAWSGTGKEGRGALTTQSGTLSDTPYSFTARFGDGKGTNPEELIAAAHAGCFTMALAFGLSSAGHPPETLETRADLTIEQEDAGWTIKAVALTLTGKVPGMSGRSVPESCRAGQSKLSGLQGAQRHHHACG